MKTYLIIASNRFAQRSALQRFLTQHPQVNYWFACLPNTVFAFSDLSAHDLAKAIEGHFGTGPGKRFLVTEVGDNRQGRLPKELWAMLRNPEAILKQ